MIVVIAAAAVVIAVAVVVVMTVAAAAVVDAAAAGGGDDVDVGAAVAAAAAAAAASPRRRPDERIGDVKAVAADAADATKASRCPETDYARRRETRESCRRWTRPRPSDGPKGGVGKACQPQADGEAGVPRARPVLEGRRGREQRAVPGRAGE